MAPTYPSTVPALLAAIAATDARAPRLTVGLSETQLYAPPPAGGWSIAQVFEHLLVSHGLYLDRMRPAIAAAPRDPPTQPWRPSLFGRLLIGAVGPDAKRRLTTARIFEPSLSPRPRVVAAFLEMQQEFAGLLRAAAGLDWRAVRLSSPVSRFIRLNLGDAFVILVVHAQRHLGQITRIRDALLES